MAVNVPLILINDLPEQEIPTDDVYLIIGGNDAKKVKVSNLSEYLKKRLQIEDITTNVGNLSTNVENLSENIDKKQDIIEDTGWIECKYGNGIVPYTSNSNARVRKIGNIVFLQGTLKNNTAWSTHDSILTFDKKFAPSQESRFLCQGSGLNRFLLTVRTTGICKVERYGTNQSQGITIKTGAWLNVFATWVTG
jgi:hypothetical protein|nr:MAG TPA: receptor binding protein [Caudoviricetes sp.]